MRSRNHVPTIREQAIALVVAGVVAFEMGTNVWAQLPGLPEARQNENAVRPSEQETKAVVTQATGPQRGSLFRGGVAAPVIGPNGEQIGGPPLSFTSVMPAQPKKFQKNDLVTIIVAESSTTETSSKSKADKKQDFDVAIEQFLQLAHSASGLPTVGVVGSPSKLPEIKFRYDNKRENEAEQNRSDTFTDRFSATVVDVKPNGTMVIEAVRQITVNKEVQQYKMSGICRVLDVTGDNTILSTQLANLHLSKKTMGEVHDAVRGGWLNRFIDKYNPF